MEEIFKHRMDIKKNILKSFQTDLEKSEENDIEKARHGIYTDNLENRKLNRVGQEYGNKKEEKEGSKRKSSRFDVTYANSTNPEGVIKAYKSVSEHTKHILRKIGYKFNMQPVDVDANYYIMLDKVCKMFSDDDDIDAIRRRIVRQFGDNKVPNIIPRKGNK